jgi:hypothetical protein
MNNDLINGWVKLHDLSSETITTGDMDNNGQDEVIIDFGRPGIWILMNNDLINGWVKLHDLSSETITTGDMDGNGLGEVITTGKMDGN